MRLRPRYVAPTVGMSGTRELTEAEQAEYDCMLAGLTFYEPRQKVWLKIREAYDSLEWDWTKSDGCSIVTDWPTPHGYRAPYGVMHDYCCWLARQATTKKETMRLRAEGDNLFFAAQVDYAVPHVMAGWRWLAVRGAWLLVFQWRV